jgi:hypothetical protein
MLATPLAAILAARPALALFPRAIVEAVLLCEGSIGSAARVAHGLGFRSRFHLARLLKRAGLPPLHRFAAWATVLSWTVTAEREGTSLRTIALRAGRYPSACYRLVRELTNRRWQEIRARGSTWVQQRFMAELKLHVTRRARRVTATRPLRRILRGALGEVGRV